MENNISPNMQARNRAAEIMKNNLPAFLIAGLVFTAIEFFSKNVSDIFTVPEQGFFVRGLLTGVKAIAVLAVSRVITAFLNAAESLFYFRAYNRGKPDFSDIMSPISGRQNASAFFRLIFIYWLIDMAIYVLALRTAVISRFIAPLILLFVSFTFGQIWYLFAANPYYPPQYYFKAALKYIGPKIFRYIWFRICTAFFPRIGIVLTSTFVFMAPGIGEILARIILYLGVSVMGIYLELASAGYINNLIPDEWFAGTAQF